MKIFKNKLILQKEISKDNYLSFVPTMGGLHKGHLSLIKKAKKYKCKICVSIFINPTQFNKKDDYKNTSLIPLNGTKEHPIAPL